MNIHYFKIYFIWIYLKKFNYQIEVDLFHSTIEQRLKYNWEIWTNFFVFYVSQNDRKTVVLFVLLFFKQQYRKKRTKQEKREFEFFD